MKRDELVADSAEPGMPPAADTPPPAQVLDIFSDLAFAVEITRLSVELVAATLQLSLEMTTQAESDFDTGAPDPNARQDRADAS
jgi:hypothetical protein